MPSAVMGSTDQQASIFREINRLYQLPDGLRSLMNERYANGYQKVQVLPSDAGEVRIRFEDKTLRSSVPNNDPAAKAGVEKWLLMREWKRRSKR